MRRHRAAIFRYITWLANFGIIIEMTGMLYRYSFILEKILELSGGRSNFEFDVVYGCASA